MRDWFILITHYFKLKKRVEVNLLPPDREVNYVRCLIHEATLAIN